MDAAAAARRKRRGRRGERVAVAALLIAGVRVLARNVRVPGCCEVDVVGRHGRTLVLVEVKARRRGAAAEAVTGERQRRLRRAAEVLLQDPRHGWAEAVRFDVVTVEALRVRHLRHAF